MASATSETTYLGGLPGGLGRKLFTRSFACRKDGFGKYCETHHRSGLTSGRFACGLLRKRCRRAATGASTMISLKFKGSMSKIIYEPWCGPFVVWSLEELSCFGLWWSFVTEEGRRRGRKGKFQLPLTNVSSSHACTGRTSHRILSDFGLGRLAKYSLF